MINSFDQTHVENIFFHSLFCKFFIIINDYKYVSLDMRENSSKVDEIVNNLQ